MAEVDVSPRTFDNKSISWAPAGAVESDETNKRTVHLDPEDVGHSKTKYESQIKEVIGDRTRIGIVTDMAPPEMQTHLQLNAGQLATCVGVQNVVVDFLRN